MNLPTLYKKTSTGAIQFWKICVRDGQVIDTSWGQNGGTMQTTLDIIHTGKNLGKTNATTPEQQAEIEAQARWTKQLKKGYVKSLEAARSGKVDEVIEGGVAPMLAHRFDQHGHKITYPAYVQPKLDGHRCIAVVEKGDATLWTRTRKPITSMQHIVEALEAWSTREAKPDIVLDGELYCHGLGFEEMTSYIRDPKGKAGSEKVKYCIYDVVGAGSFEQRLDELDLWRWRGFESLKLVATDEVDGEGALQEAFEEYLSDGFEGAMVRNADGLYKHGRSYDLQKLKEMEDGEFLVTDVEEGRGKLAGHAIFVCVTEAGDMFRAKLKGRLNDLRDYFEKPELAVGKWLTVKYQGLTGKNGVPRFPVALRFRQDL